MDILTLNDLSRNAFRVLGLTAAATQTDVDAAARRLRIWQDPSMIPPTANDAAWMGPVLRAGRDVENAVARLAEPVTRVHERFWWFCERPPEVDEPSFDRPTSAAAAHDDAL